MGDLEFPLRTAEELARALGPGASLVVRGEQILAVDAGGRIPAYYFPIVSENDLSTKLADLAWPGPDSGVAGWSGNVKPSNEPDAGGW